MLALAMTSSYFATTTIVEWDIDLAEFHLLEWL